MKVLKMILKPFSFLPAIAMMCAIYFFSAQTGEVSGQLSYEISYQIVETKNEILNTHKTYDQLAVEADSIHYYVRKAAHMTEYFLLAIAVSFPLYVYGIRGFWLILTAGAVCVGFAGFDEYHQSMVDGRGPAVKDVMIDSAGAGLGILAAHAGVWLLGPVKSLLGIPDSAWDGLGGRRVQVAVVPYADPFSSSYLTGISIQF